MVLHPWRTANVTQHNHLRFTVHETHIIEGSVGVVALTAMLFLLERHIATSLNTNSSPAKVPKHAVA